MKNPGFAVYCEKQGRPHVQVKSSQVKSSQVKSSVDRLLHSRHCRFAGLCLYWVLKGFYFLLIWPYFEAFSGLFEDFGKWLEGRMQRWRTEGFTLIEMSMVLVVIGLLVGGVLVGVDLVKAAETRATISQVEQFNTEKNAFYSKYNSLPGDLNGNAAYQYGISTDGFRMVYSGYPGMGDGNGLLEGVGNPQFPSAPNGMYQGGEPAYFWQDLASVYGIPVSSNTCPGYPEAKVGNGNCFFVWSGGVNGGNGINYYNLSAYVNLNGYGRCSDCLASNPGLTVSQAYAIDKKIDDGLPQSGNVKALYLSANNQGGDYICWAGVGTQNQGGIPAISDAGYTTATTGSSTSCFDNGGVAGAAQQYSMSQNNGAYVNCALSFKFQ